MEPSRPSADVLLVHGQAWTGLSDHPPVQALALGEGRILAMGTDQEMLAWRGAGTRVIDLGARRVLPGFIDSHAHLVWGGTGLLQVDLRGVRSPGQFRDTLARAAQEAPAGAWVLGGNWNERDWDLPALPTRHLIDAVTPGNPVLVTRSDCHMALANTVALGRAGITATTPDPPGGAIQRDEATGEPTGIVMDCAMALVRAVQPEPTRTDLERAIQAALRHAASLGVTSIHDVTEWEHWDVLRAMRERGELNCLRVCARTPALAWERQAAWVAEQGPGDDWLRLAGLKGFVDGSLGSTTAFFFEPYDDAPESCGLLQDQVLPFEAFEARCQAADRAGLQLSVHAIGDRANAMLLDTYQRVATTNGPRDRRLRVEHAQHLRPQDIPRMAGMEVIASVQPYHASDDGSWAEERIGPVRARTTYPFRSLLDAGVRLALGTDWPVAPLDPIETLYAAVTRCTLDGKHPRGWHPEQRITLEEALRGYTQDAAFAAYQEHRVGTLAPGMLADLVVLDRDLLALPPDEWRGAKPWCTVVGGRVVHSSP